MASVKSRVAELEARIGDLDGRHQGELKKQQEKIFNKLFAAVDSYRRSTLYGVQLLQGPLDLRPIDLGRLYTSPEEFNILLSSQQEVDARRLRDATLITLAAEEYEQGESGEEAGAQIVSSTRE